jgi:hypothetical protein
MALMTILLLSLTALSDAAEWPPNPEDEGAFRSEWGKVRQNYERGIRAHQEQIARIEARERVSVEPLKRAEKLTRGAAAGTRAYLPDDSRGQRLAQAAEKAAHQASTLAAMDRAQAEYLDSAIAEWGARGEQRRKLQEAGAALQKNLDDMRSHLVEALKSVAAMSAAVPESGVPEKVARSEALAKEAGKRLSARWELERQAREREREQREREMGERTRGGRIP